MRFLINIQLDHKNTILPYDHQYHLYSYMLRTIQRGNPQYSLELHKPRKYKHFTFSYLMTKARRTCERGIVVDGNEVYFLVSSPDAGFLKTLVEGMLSHPEVKIKTVKGWVSEIRVLKEPEIKHTMKFSTLSPIIVKKTENIEQKNGKSRFKWIELYPKDGAEFTQRLVKNLKNRFEDYYGINAEKKDLKIQILEFKPKRHNIAGTYHRASLCRMVVHGDRDLIKYGYEAGFGEKNAMGFGMVRVVE